MIAAIELLSKPSIPMRDVARLVGYSQPPHFARTFRQRFGVSPSIFRAEYAVGFNTQSGEPREGKQAAQSIVIVSRWRLRPRVSVNM